MTHRGLLSILLFFCRLTNPRRRLSRLLVPLYNPRLQPHQLHHRLRRQLHFVLHHIPEDQTGAAKEAMIQAGLMMDRLKVVYENSKAAYDASSALQTNVRVSGIVS